ncbi:lipid phosphate phosphatase epsilon 2, chloroplastic-like [Wolffia australiana]
MAAMLQNTPTIARSSPRNSAKPIFFLGKLSSKRLDFQLGKGKNKRLKSGMRAQPEGTELNELVKAPEFGIDDGRGDEIGARMRKEEAVVLENGSLKFDLDFSSQGLESTLNKLSKWIVAGLFGVVILWKHDAEAIWTAMGSVINAMLSNQLKQVFNHQRPDPSLRSDPGMPSSHAQSIFYAASYVVISLIDSLGVNFYTLSLVFFTIACGVYLSWIRVSQRLHTVEQVTVGATIGAAFCVGWFYLWRGLVLEAFVSSLWLRIFIVLVSFGFCIGFVVYVVRTWLVDNEESL